MVSYFNSPHPPSLVLVYSLSERARVIRSEAGQFQAHAWVESNGVVVIGGTETQLARYAELPVFEGKGL